MFHVLKIVFVELGILALVCCLTPSYLSAEDKSAASILKATQIKSGLGLIVGSKSIALSKSLVSTTDLYLQVIAKDLLASQVYGNEIVNSPLREKLGVRLSKFNANHYGSLLFNIIVVEETSDLNDAKAIDLNRILIPNGFLVMNEAPANFEAEALKLGMTKIVIPGWKHSFKRGPEKKNWKIINSFKWRAGSRAQWSSGWKALTFGSGKFLYLECMEVPTDSAGSRSLLWARDAYNGRVLWKKDLGYATGRGRGKGAAAVSDNNVVMITTMVGKVRKLMCLDARNGKVISEVNGEGHILPEKVGWIRFIENKFIVYGAGRLMAFDTNGKGVWKSGAGGRISFTSGKIIIYNGRNLTVKQLKDGKDLWSIAHKTKWVYQVYLTTGYIHVSHGDMATNISMKTGKIISTFNATPLKPYHGRFKTQNDSLYYCRYYPYPKGKASDFLWSKVDPKTGKTIGKELQSGISYKANMCAPVIHGVGDYFVYFFNVWVKPETGKREYTYLAHPSCGIGTKFINNMAYNTPSRKSGPLQGISASCASDITFNHKAGGEILEKFSKEITQKESVKTTDWAMYRNNKYRGNDSAHAIGSELIKSWEVSIGLGGKTYGEMHEQRLGLTQPVVAFGLVIVADILSQRIVALDQKTGKQKWAFHVGSRVDLSPTLHKGMCLFTSKDGWVWCLDATTGKLRWRLLMSPQERLIGGQDKLESQWPVVSDVMITKDGIGFVSCGIDTRTLGGLRAMAFDVESGNVIWKQCYAGEMEKNLFTYVAADIFSQGDKPEHIYMGRVKLDIKTGAILNIRRKEPFVLQGPKVDDFLAGGISLPRNAEDRAGVAFSSGIAKGKSISFNKGLSVAYTGGGGPETWQFKGKLRFFAKNKRDRKSFVWNIEGNELVADSIILANDLVYAAGHYYRTKGKPELQIRSAKDGALIKQYPLGSYPSMDGMSLAGNSLFITTRDGKLICFSKK